MRHALTALLFAAAATPAAAMGGAWCDADDAKATVSVQAALTRAAGAVVTFEGKLAVKGEKPLAAVFGRDDLAQFWFDGTEMRFLLYREADDTSAIEVEIRASAGEEENYAGEYRIRLHAVADGESVVTEQAGPVSCSAD